VDNENQKEREYCNNICTQHLKNNNAHYDEFLSINLVCEMLDRVGLGVVDLFFNAGIMILLLEGEGRVGN